MQFYKFCTKIDNNFKFIVKINKNSKSNLLVHTKSEFSLTYFLKSIELFFRSVIIDLKKNFKEVL